MNRTKPLIIKIIICCAAAVVLGLIFISAVAKGIIVDIKMPRGYENRMRAQEVMLRNNEMVEQLLNEARAQLAAGQSELAIDIFERTIEFAPYDFRPYLLLAQTYMRLQRVSDAFEVLGRAGRTGSDQNVMFAYFGKWNEALDQKPADITPKQVSIAPFKDNKSSAINFQFDDVSQGVYVTILPIFEEFGFRATLPVNPGLVPEDISSPETPASWEELKDAVSRGFEVANHTMTHRRLRGLPEEEMEHQVNKSYDILTEKIGQAPLSFSFPFDFADQRAIDKVLERHIAVRDHGLLAKIYSRVFIPVYGGKNFSVKTANRIIDWAVNHGIWIVAECHTLHSERVKSFKPLTEEFLRGHLSYIKKYEDKIWVDTFINIYRYVAERQKARVNIINGGENRVTFTINTSLDSSIYSYPLTVIINTSPIKPSVAIAIQGNRMDRLDVKIDKDKIFLNIVPDNGPIHVEWK